jgi:hypothetical protein
VSSTIKRARSSLRVILSRCDEESRRALLCPASSVRTCARLVRKVMKSIKATAIVFFVAIVAALVGANANAQSPSAGSTAQAAGGIPEKAPPGWDQAAWTAIRENCERNLLEMGRRAQLTVAQRSLLPPLNFSHGDMMLCAHLSVRPQTSLQPSTPSPPQAGVAPTPTTSAPVGQIPETVPPNWKANGWDQSSWTGFREHCRAIFAHPGKFAHHEWVTCANVSVAFSFLPEPSMTPLAPGPGISPTPLGTPLPLNLY